MRPITIADPWPITAPRSQLASLDLSGNKLTEVLGLERLETLSSLTLGPSADRGPSALSARR
jgi:Leucine-rich repeat (LRR) protein